MSAPTLFTGKITEIKQTRTFQSGSASREFWAVEMETDKSRQKYPNELAFEVSQGKNGPSKYSACPADLDSFRVGDVVSFSFSAAGRRWEKDGQQPRVFVNLRVATKINLVGASERSSAPAAAEPDFSAGGDEEDMPF